MSNFKEKHVNIRITETVDKQIQKVKSEMESQQGIQYSRSQIIFMLIVRGIQKYTEEQMNPYGGS